ncbi:hypothetical protein Ddye_003869 [Dipteronia dyeriana]|uniref:Organ specific protein n=1 Tax=Dipteronia dyeriana TaxID=168575 RepID=A0AAD9WKJ1_9ROSI|nr:hypothetical protein Ddye_032437 [Dipteronia dyeriana]KAK2665295.1 hypothetical protein Ddye_003869 [Dipteronia dyeriana]
MKALFVALSTLSLLLLFASITDARKDLGEYWRAVMKEQSMPESIQGLIPESDHDHQKADDCQTSENSEVKKEIYVDDHSSKPTGEINYEWRRDVIKAPVEKISFVKDFDPVKPDVSIYDNGVEPIAKRFFVKDFEPVKPDVSIYDNGIKLIEKRSFVKDFEPVKPDVSIYDNDIKLYEKRSFVKDFEPVKPDVSIYDNGIKPIGKRFFVKDFEPVKPDVSIYENDIKPTKDFSSTKNFDPRLEVATIILGK